MEIFGKNIFHNYPMYLLECDKRQLLDINSKKKIDYFIINKENYKKVAQIRPGEQYRKEFKKMLEAKAVGIAAQIDNKIVGYGWAKFTESDDKFFYIDDNICLLASFFVNSDYRGNNIYPNLILKLISKTSMDLNYDKWYIAIFKDNISSLRGAKKIGFKLKKEYNFYRFMKLTLNKKKIKD